MQRLITILCFFIVTATSGNSGGPAQSVDDLLFGSPTRKIDGTEKTDIDILSDVLSNQSLGITETEQSNSFTGQWQSMFGRSEESDASTFGLSTSDSQQMMSDDGKPKSITNDKVDTGIKSQRMFMPSFLLDQMHKTDPKAVKEGASKDFNSMKDSKTPPMSRKNKKGDGKDMSAWFDLFADLDPLANPDEIGASLETAQEKQAC